MFSAKTFKSKLFWTGVSNLVAGGIMVYHGQVELGLGLIAGGLTAITGSDRMTKILDELKRK